MREISNTEGYLRGKVQGNLRGRSTHAVQSITTVYTSIRARELPGHVTAGTAHTGTGTSVPVPVPGKILGHGTGGLGCFEAKHHSN